MGFIWPAAQITDRNYQDWISDRFGPRDGSMHHGVDLGLPGGTPILAIYSGTVRDEGTGTGAGNYIVIEHDPAAFSYYLHMRARSTLNAGDRVETGQILGYVGTTGDSTGNHLHLGISGSGNWAGFVDPIPYILARRDTTPTVRPGSLITLAQAQELADWLGRPYDTKAYWIDLQQQGAWASVYDGAIDGVPGPKTFAAEASLWQINLAPKPPVVVPPVEPEKPIDPVPPTEPEEPTMPTTPPIEIPPVSIPAVPDVIIPARGRALMYLFNWLAGVVLAAIVAGWLATGNPPPTQLLVALAVYGSVSANVSLIAKANVPK